VHLLIAESLCEQLCLWTERYNIHSWKLLIQEYTPEGPFL
jgi:hypothetical protein